MFFFTMQWTKQNKLLQFGELIFGIQFPAGVWNLMFLSCVLQRTVTNNDKNDNMTRPHVHLRGGGRERRGRIIQSVDFISILLQSLGTCMTDNSNSKNLDLRVFLHWPSKPLPRHDGCLMHSLSFSWRKRNTWDSRAEKSIHKGNTSWSGRRSQAKSKNQVLKINSMEEKALFGMGLFLPQRSCGFPSCVLLLAIISVLLWYY